MKEETHKLLDKAAHAIRAARLLLENGRPARSHSGVHSLFCELFAKPGRLDSKYHRWMLDAFDQRIEGDYGFDAVLPSEKSREMIEQASEFLIATEAFLSGPG